MHKGQLARLPVLEGRRADRRVVNLAASLREPGASIAEAEVLNLSGDGFMAVSDMELEGGQHVWLKLPGHEAQKSLVVWVEGKKAGFQFSSPLHRSELEQLLEAARRPLLKNHFGPRRY